MYNREATGILNTKTLKARRNLSFVSSCLRVLFIILTVLLPLLPLRAQQKPHPIPGVETMQKVQDMLTKGGFVDVQAKMIDSMGIHLVPLIHFNEDTALAPLLLELYIKYQAKYPEPYVSIRINCDPTGSSWLDFMKYRFSITLAQGTLQALPPAMLSKVETTINKELEKLGTVEDMIGKAPDIFGSAFGGLGKAFSDSTKAKVPIVRFYMAQNNTYGFDAPSQQEGAKYETFKRIDSTVLVPWKSLGIKPDEVMATVQIRDTTTRLDSIVFRNGKGQQLFPKNPKAQPFVLTLTGSGHKNEDEITAYYKTTDIKGNPAEIPIGQLQTISYTPKKKNVVLVPVGSVTLGEIQTELNRIYGQAVCEWTVTVASPFTISTTLYQGEPGAGTISIETGMFKSYTGETQAIIDAFKQTNPVDKNTCYLFVTSIGNDKGYAGYMPLNAQFGFIFTGQGGSTPRTIAHELGHSLGLKHPYNATDSRMNTEDNLMAYSTSTRLHQGNWKEVHDWDLGLGWGQKEEEGAGILPNTPTVIKIIENIRCSYVKNKPCYLAKLANYYALGCVKLLDGNSYCNLSVNSRHKNWYTTPIARAPVNGIFYVSHEGAGTPFSTTKEDLVVRADEDNQNKLYTYLYPKDKAVWKSQLISLQNAICNAPDHSEFIDKLYTYPDEAFGEDLDLATRKKILKRLTEGIITESWLGSIDREGLAVKLISETPVNQRQFVLEYLTEKNNELLKLFWDKLHEQSLDAFINTITQWVSKIKNEPDWKLFDYPAYWQNDKKRITKFFTIWKIHEQNDLFSLRKFTCSSYFISNNKKISFEAIYDYNKNDQTPSIICYNEIDALDWVAIEFAEDLPKLQIKEGDRFVVPMIWLKWISTRINLDDDLSDIRIVGDIIATLTPLKYAKLATRAPEAAKFLTNLSRVLPLIDIARVNSEELILSKFGEDGKTALEAWDRVYTIYAIGEGSVVTYNVSKTFIQNSANLYNKIKDINTYIKIAGNSPEALNFRQKFLLLYEKIREALGLAKGADLLELTVNGKLIGKFSRGNSLEIIDAVTLHGGNTIKLSPNKTTTVTGTLDDVNLVAERGVNADKTFNGVTAANVENVGGINILRSPKWGQIKNKYKTVNGAGQTAYDWGKISDEFWETVNRPWLDEAITRGDKLRLVSNPSNAKAVHVTDDVGNFVLDANGNKIKSIFGREVDYLKSKGYTILSDGTAVK